MATVMRKFFHSALSISNLLVLALAWPSFVHADDALAVADRLAQQHLAYVYGSEDLHKGGLDCSGFVQVVFREAYGVELPDEADKQLDYLRQHGQVWDSTSDWKPSTLQPGDLVFYAGPNQLPRTSLISHVMMYCGHDVVVGAQGKGRQLDGAYSGVGYYHFWPNRPAGVLGESGERFLNHFHVFAYGRLNAVQGQGNHPPMISTPTPVQPPGAAGSNTATIVTHPNFRLRSILMNPYFD